MNDEWRRQTKPLILEGGIHMPYSWTVGRLGSRFLIELRDHGRIMGNRCPKCQVVWVPPRMRCPECYEEIGDQGWKEVGPQGTLRHFTVVRYEHPAQPMKPPFAYGLIDLDGAGRAITHLVSGVDLAQLKAGTRMQPVWRSNRQGNILDIAYFTPIGG
jgi:uncharacterized OB-fold protein